jgi:hypothetical protein
LLTRELWLLLGVPSHPKLPFNFLCASTMLLSRAQAKDVFNHVLDNVLERDHSSPLKQALVGEGIQDIFALLCLDGPTIESLKYYNFISCGTNDVNRGDKAMLHTFLKFMVSKTSSEDPSNESFWTSITRDGFDEFRSSFPKFHNYAASNPVVTVVDPVALVSPCKTKSKPLLPHVVKHEEFEVPAMAPDLEVGAKLEDKGDESVIYGEPVIEEVVKSQATLKSVPKVKGTKVASKAKKKSQLYKGSKPKSPAFHCTKEVSPAVYASMNGKPLDMNGEPLDGYFEELTALQ